MVSNESGDLSSKYVGQGFHLGLWPNLNPLLILSGVNIVLKSVHCAPFL